MGEFNLRLWRGVLCLFYFFYFFVSTQHVVMQRTFGSKISTELNRFGKGG